MAELFFIDDSNTQTINYETLDLWFPKSVSEDLAYDGTVTAGVTGAQASLTFSGSAIGVVGIATTVKGAQPPVVQFSVDGSEPVTTTAPNNGTTDYRLPFFAVEGLSPTQHSFKINVVNASTSYPFFLDVIAYEPLSGATPTASQIAVTSTLPTATVTITSAASKSSSGAPVGAIVGGVIGGVAVLIAAAVAIYFLCFRRRSNGKPYFYASSVRPGDLLGLDDEVKPTPYTPGPSAVPTLTSAGPQSQYGAGSVAASSAYPGPGAPSAYARSEAPMSEYSAGTSTSGPSYPPALSIVTNSPPLRVSPNQPRSKAAEAGLLSVPQPATFHADSGVRFNAMGEPVAGEASSSSAVTSQVLASQELADVPPSYSAA
ncbi:hypothetical protein BN946_scf185015.g81 [Trametes cinnabarina]|uniref:Mid2 domain-containing protein n=1 Tax=Pycnoporus cinnabarinus TaxID=5643 RepID=A0A060SMV2_PYCCI|nr:hypothetical protein BN946_scf185015.g81 [Trametes cinnabarina]